LEFLGDAVLNLIVSHLLMQQNPELKEGELSRIRANLVNESQLAEMASNMDLGAHMQLGKGEIQTNGRQKKSLLADAFEAVVAAVYLDSGFVCAFNMVKHHFKSLITETATPTATAVQDYKSQLQELVQMSRQPLPNYQVVHESGPDHDKTFRVQLTVCEYQTEGTGKSKKAAEQDAARRALALLNRKDQDA
jgi:ribonuclease III